MSMEAWDADDWLFATLTRDATLRALIGDRVFPDLAPEGTAEPYVIYTLMSGQDADSLGLDRATARLVYLVKAVGRGSYTPLRPVTDRIDALMQGARAAQGSVRLTVSRQGLRRYREFVSEARYSHAGGIYSIVAQPVTQDD